MKFTKSQLEAIRHGDTNLQLIACAGSGKTEVVAQRVANLLKAGLKPGNIIAFTFTDKAAAELKDRIVTRCREAMGDVYGLAEMYVGTIHGFCLDLLMTEVHEALKFNVLNEVQQTLFIDRHSKASGLTTCTDLSGALLKRYRDDVENILTFQKRYPKVNQIRLEENFRSSEGIIETARKFIEQNTARLPKNMKPTAAQPFEPGDICAVQFDDPAAEAEYFVKTAQALHGVAFKDPTEDDPKHERGLAWSDMAILLRSVSRNAAPITSALDAANIRYVIVGMNNLFDTREAHAARELFYYMAGRTASDATTVFDAWTNANLGLAPTDLQSAIANVTKSRAALENPTERFGFYSIQRTFTTFLEQAGVREERILGRGEVVFYNLGKFSQLISDFETIHYHSKPKEKHESFGNFLEFHAENAYPEGWQNNQYANPDAIRIMTVHQAKGMQWPVVFVPALIKNRFPSKAQGGRSVWHILPAAAIPKQARYRGTIEDERRLFYVAVTRSQKFLHLTYAPVPGNQLFRSPSEFLTDVYVSKYVKRKATDYSARKRLPPTPRKGVANVVFSFSDVKYFFECPYQFKLRILYGFNAPIHEALGYGRSLHNALAEVHARALDADYATPGEADSLTERHLHTPYAYEKLREKLEQAAARVISDYIKDNQADLKNIEFSEKKIDIPLDDGVSVVGRIDLVRRKDTGQTTIVDLKSNDRAQPEQITEAQLHIYALGYQELTGKNADLVEIYELDERKRNARAVDEDFIKDVKAKVATAAKALRAGTLNADPHPKKCAACDYLGMCTAGQQAAVTKA